LTAAGQPAGTPWPRGGGNTGSGEGECVASSNGGMARASEQRASAKHWQKMVGDAAGEREGKLNRCRSKSNRAAHIVVGSRPKPTYNFIFVGLGTDEYNLNIFINTGESMTFSCSVTWCRRLLRPLVAQQWWSSKGGPCCPWTYLLLGLDWGATPADGRNDDGATMIS
jgi:hypothetical protein